LIEKDEVIFRVWKYLQNTTSKQIRSLPDVTNATELQTINGFSQLAQEEKWLIGFCSNGGSAVPKNFSGRHNFNSWNKDKNRIAESLCKIKHWVIIYGDYSSISNQKCTWYIDPPYQEKGKWYREHDIDYPKLAKWCKTRKGQVIVCENVEADWLPFDHLKDVHFTHFKTDEDKKKKTAEGIYIQDR
jgi:16S rRNA G966 N2-methylase RsmD